MFLDVWFLVKQANIQILTQQQLLISVYLAWPTVSNVPVHLHAKNAMSLLINGMKHHIHVIALVLKHSIMIRLHKLVRIVKLYIVLCATVLAINVINASMAINQFKALKTIMFVQKSRVSHYKLIQWVLIYLHCSHYCSCSWQKFDLIRLNIKINIFNNKLKLITNTNLIKIKNIY